MPVMPVPLRATIARCPVCKSRTSTKCANALNSIWTVRRSVRLLRLLCLAVASTRGRFASFAPASATIAVRNAPGMKRNTARTVQRPASNARRRAGRWPDTVSTSQSAPSAVRAAPARAARAFLSIPRVTPGWPYMSCRSLQRRRSLQSLEQPPRAVSRGAGSSASTNRNRSRPSCAGAS